MKRWTEKLRESAFSSCVRIPRTWKVTVSWGTPVEVGKAPVLPCSGFAATLRTRWENAIYKADKPRRVVLSSNWRTYEQKLLGRAAEAFKKRVLEEATNRQHACVSFDVISRSVQGFPRHTASVFEAHLVEDWAGSSAEEWHYATNGLEKMFAPGTCVPYGDLLGNMIDRFVATLALMDFTTCVRVPGTWKVAVTWRKTESATGRYSEDRDDNDRNDAKYFRDTNDSRGDKHLHWVASASKRQKL